MVKINWVKRVEDMKENQLAEGESVVAVAFLQPGGAFNKQVASGAVGGLLGMFVGSKVSKKSEEQNQATVSPMTKEYPKENTVVAVTTSSRLMIYNQDVLSGKPKKYLKEYKKGDFKAKDFQKGKMKNDLTLVFSDGGELLFDAPKGQDIDTFMSSL